MGAFNWNRHARSNAWDDRENWDPKGIPGADDFVVIDAGVSAHRAPTPPSATSIASLELRSGVLNGRVRVTGPVLWTGGGLPHGLEVGARQLTIRGDNRQFVQGDLIGMGRIALEDTTVAVGHGAEIRGFVQWSCSGVNEINGGAGGGGGSIRIGAAVLLQNSVTSVRNNVDMYIGRMLELAADARLELSGPPAYVEFLATSKVVGKGTLKLDQGAEMFAMPGSTFGAEVAVVVSGLSKVRGSRPPRFGSLTSIGRLEVHGVLLLSGGSLLQGSVDIGGKGKMLVEGSNHIRECAVKVRGSFEAAASAQLDTRLGSLVLSGKSHLRSGSQIYGLQNEGTLETHGPAKVSLAGGLVVNTGTIIAESGELELASATPYGFTQRAGGILELKELAVISTPSTLGLAAGTLRGSGTIRGSVEQHGATVIGRKFRNNKPIEPGTLRVEGDYAQIGDRSRLALRIDGFTPNTEHSVLDATGTVELAGTLDLGGMDFSPSVGAQIEIIRADSMSTLYGRFKTLQLPGQAVPPTVRAHFLRLVYEGNFAYLAGAGLHVGFDTMRRPNDGVMRQWFSSSPYRWVNYYLEAHCHNPSNWIGSRGNLIQMGWSILVTYVGHQEPGTGCQRPMNLTRAQGLIDGADAVAKTRSEGFQTGTWIYLDVEVRPTPIGNAMLDYIDGWTSAVISEGTYNPGVYLHQRDADPVITTMATAFRRLGRRDRPRVWAVGGPATPAITDAPHMSGVPEAVVWQQSPLDRTVTWSGTRLQVDVDVSVLTNPSGDEMPPPPNDGSPSVEGATSEIYRPIG